MKIFKLILKVIVLVILFVLVWYSIGRLLSNHNAINSYAISESLEVRDSTSLTVMTFNVAHGRGNKLGASNWQENGLAELKKHLGKIANLIVSLNPDIVVLNEVDFSSVWSFHFNQARYLAEKTSLPYVVEQKNIDVSIPFVKYQFGNAILSKYPLKDAKLIKHVPLSKRENVFAGNHDAVYATTETQFGDIGIVAVHFDYRSEESRLNAIKQVVDLSSNLEFPTIILGDFNSTPTGYPKSSLTNTNENALSYLINQTEFKTDSRISDNSAYYTFPKERPDRIIDWIFVNRRLAVKNLKVINSDLSDHLPVVATIQFNQKMDIQD